MRRRDAPRISASQRAGVVAAAAAVPISLVPSLRRRSAVDQGVITGLSAALDYALTAAAHDVVMRASRTARRVVGSPADAAATARTTVAVDLVALAAASVVVAALPWRPDESLPRAAVRTAAGRIRAAAVASAVPGAVDMLPGGGGRFGTVVRSVPGMVALGTGVSAAVQQARVRRLAATGEDVAPSDPAPLGQSLAVGALTAAGAVGFASLERRIARGADGVIRRATGAQGLGGLASHVLSLGVIGTGALGAVGWMAHRVEARVWTPDGHLAPPPTVPWVSGGPGSVVPWDGLGREARRHLAALTPAADVAAVMGAPARQPLRLYVGLRSAADDAGRVALALAELERTGALDRSLLVLCSPTGSGYVNDTAVSAWEYLSGGDCATLTVQYSARPSVLSLDRLDEGRALNRAVVTALAAAIAARPAHRRPRLVLFGESLGAFTGQDAFLHTGTRGLHACLVDRALWLGTPEASGWAREVRDLTRPDVHPGEVLRLASADDIEALEPPAAAAARYVLLNHHDDGVTVLGFHLLVRCPAWLADERSPAIPPQAAWSTPVTFLQTGIDAKNAADTTPGRFTSAGHDYRGDLARAVRFAFDLPCSAEQLRAVEAALRRDDLLTSRARMEMDGAPGSATSPIESSHVREHPAHA